MSFPANYHKKVNQMLCDFLSEWQILLINQVKGTWLLVQYCKDNSNSKIQLLSNHGL